MNGPPRAAPPRASALQAQGQPASQFASGFPQVRMLAPAWGPPNQTRREWGSDAACILQPPHRGAYGSSSAVIPVPRFTLSWNQATSPKAEGKVDLGQQLLRLQKEPGSPYGPAGSPEWVFCVLLLSPTESQSGRGGKTEGLSAPEMPPEAGPCSSYPGAAPQSTGERQQQLGTSLGLRGPAPHSCCAAARPPTMGLFITGPRASSRADLFLPAGGREQLGRKAQQQLPEHHPPQGRTTSKSPGSGARQPRRQRPRPCVAGDRKKMRGQTSQTPTQ